MSAMGWDLDTTVGKLHRFWWWCVDFAEDGDLRKFTDETIGSVVALNEAKAKVFVEAMVAACWLDRKPYFRVHDWWDYAGPYLIGKYKRSPDKWQRIRAAYSNVTVTSHSPPLPTDLPTRRGAGAGGDVDDAANGDALDSEIHQYIGGHPNMLWDIKTHANIRRLVELVGWDKAKTLVNQAVAKGKPFPAGWALTVAASKDAQRDVTAAEPTKAQRAIAKVAKVKS